MADHQSNKSLQLLQTILVSVLLGCTAWLAMAVIQTRDDVIAMKVQNQERLGRLDRIDASLDLTIKTQQQVLRELLQLKNTDAETTSRVDRLERAKP